MWLEGKETLRKVEKTIKKGNDVRYEWYRKDEGAGKEVAVGGQTKINYVWKPPCTPT